VLHGALASKHPKCKSALRISQLARAARNLCPIYAQPPLPTAVGTFHPLLQQNPSSKPQKGSSSLRLDPNATTHHRNGVRVGSWPPLFATRLAAWERVSPSHHRETTSRPSPHPNARVGREDVGERSGRVGTRRAGAELQSAELLKCCCRLAIDVLRNQHQVTWGI
jgi:hypothetical protein